MAKLIVNLGGEIIAQKNVEEGARITIGRHPANDIVLDNVAVSSRHAVVYCKDDKCFVEDLESTNGVVMNDFRIRRKEIKDGDVFEIVKYMFRFIQHTVTFED